MIATISCKTLRLVQMVSQADDLALEVEAKRRHPAAPPLSADSLAGGAATSAISPPSTTAKTHDADSSGSAAAVQLGSGPTALGHPQQDYGGSQARTDTALDQQQRFGEGLWWPSKAKSGTHQETFHCLLRASSLIAFLTYLSTTISPVYWWSGCPGDPRGVPTQRRFCFAPSLCCVASIELTARLVQYSVRKTCFCLSPSSRRSSSLQ